MTTFRGTPHSSFLTLDGEHVQSGADGLFELPAKNFLPALAAGLMLVDDAIESQVSALEQRIAALES
jgi:hypothetical protein